MRQQRKSPCWQQVLQQRVLQARARVQVRELRRVQVPERLRRVQVQQLRHRSQRRR